MALIKCTMEANSCLHNESEITRPLHTNDQHGVAHFRGLVEIPHRGGPAAGYWARRARRVGIGAVLAIWTHSAATDRPPTPAERVSGRSAECSLAAQGSAAGPLSAH